MKGDHEIRLLRQHLSISNWSSSLAELLPIRWVMMSLHSVIRGPVLGHRVCSPSTAFNDHEVWISCLQSIQFTAHRIRIRPVTVAAHENLHTNMPSLNRS